MKYLSKLDLVNLTDEELSCYTYILMKEQSDLLDLIDLWTNSYNLLEAETNKRNAKQGKMHILNDSETRH